jgi:hypothetical protein
MLKLARALGFETEPGAEGDFVRLRLKLQEPPAAEPPH